MGNRRKASFILGYSSRNYISSINYCTVNKDIFCANKSHSPMKKNKFSLRGTKRAGGGSGGGRAAAGAAVGGGYNVVYNVAGLRGI